MNNLLAFIIVALLQLFTSHAYGQEARGDQAVRSTRITFGVDVLPGQGPWAVSLRRPFTADPASRGHYCGGSFVSPRYNPVSGLVQGWSPSDRRPEWVVTAAHCVVVAGKVIDESILSVLGGTANLSIPTDGEEQPVEKIIVHFAYNDKTLENDIALIKLRAAEKDVPTTLRTSIRMPSISDISWATKPYLAVRAQGWGRTERGYQSRTLLEVMLPLVDRSVCRAAFEPIGEQIPDGAVCAGFVSGDFDSCQGDSGGPLIYRSQSATPSPSVSADPTLLGVISWGIGCGLADLYGVYSSTLFYRKWAEEVVASYYQRQ